MEISITAVDTDKVRVAETHRYEDERKTTNEYVISKEIYLANLQRDREILTQQIASAEEALVSINSAIESFRKE